MLKDVRPSPYIVMADTAAIRRSPDRRRFYCYLKRGLDLVVLALMAPAVLWMVAVLAVLVKLDGGSAFYSQPRLGKSGKVFRLWKLRTMVPDADAMLETYLSNSAAARREWDETQKLKEDPRITAIGRYLRKYSLDELPQLWNVVIGDMSLVGPRPMFPEQRKLYPGTAYFDLRPGLTGLWQIGVRNGSSFAERAIHDTRYADTLSLKTDLAILCRTPGAMLRGTGC